MNSRPLISVVTPSFNQAAFIGDALASVRIQNYANYEHLVIDGLSKDGTVSILRQAATDADPARLFWSSEPDSGQSEAINKGFRRAKGEIIGWLNSDDRYRPGCFERVVQCFEDNPDLDIVYGDYLTIDDSGNPVQLRREIEFSPFILMYHRVLYIPSTATFFRRKVLEEGNALDENLHYAMDLEFFIRLSARGYRFAHIPAILADFRLQPNSKTCSYPDKQRAEHEQVIYAAASILRSVKSPKIKTLILAFLRLIACFVRCSEKLLKGYYWERFPASASDRIEEQAGII